MHIRESIARRVKKSVKFTEHARLAMRDDNLTTHNVLAAAQSFQVVEKYLDAKPFPACLLLCRLDDGSPLHVVCALPESVDMLIIVTVYKPSESEWSDQGRRRK
ncbi:MAG: DUF4258 domain-containing protein [Thaumarchaeota archaeon]|nr:DUF4258 domain-containing protein [Nitrososphaerota archaeon]